MKQFFHQDFVLPILLGLILVQPEPTYAATATDQISADSNDADQDGTGEDAAATDRLDITDDINAYTVWAFFSRRRCHELFRNHDLDDRGAKHLT